MNATPESQTDGHPSTEGGDLVDVRDMVVVHTALLREFRLASAAVRRAQQGSSAQRKAVLGHLDLMCGRAHV